jgi:cell wall-associated NlpC family hydrolase
MPLVACITAVAPLRSEPSHSSEMVSQLLLGELATIIDEVKGFLKVQCQADGYEGWCQANQVMLVSPLVANEYVQNPPKYCADTVGVLKNKDGLTQISIGTPLLLKKPKLAKLGKLQWQLKKVQTVAAGSEAFTQVNIEKVVGQLLNTPYLWGGRSAFGIDCSGLTQLVLKLFGYQLPRDAKQQVNHGEVVGFLQEVKCGDLAFFDDAEGSIIHVGLLLNHDTIVHAYDKVRIDRIDTEGIINTSTKLRTHRLRVIKRIIP